MGAAARITPCQSAHRRPVPIAGVQPPQQLGERHERFTDDPDVHVRDETQDVVRHAREESSAGNEQRLRRVLLGHLRDVLDRLVRGRDPADADHVPAVGLQDLHENRVGRAPGVRIVDLDQVPLTHRERREQRHTVGDVARIVLLSDDRIDEQHLSHARLRGPSRSRRPAGWLVVSNGLVCGPVSACVSSDRAPVGLGAVDIVPPRER